MQTDSSEAMSGRRPRSFRRTASLLALALLVSACAGTPEGGGWDVVMPAAADVETTRIAGPVTYMDLEGGLYVIRGTDGTNYNPTNLPDAYREDGLRVEADVVRRDDMASIGMVGPIIDVVRIRRADGQATDDGGA